CTASMDSVRIVLTTSWSRRSCSVVAALFTALLIRRPSKAPMVTPRRGPCQRKVQPTRAWAGRLECRQASERPATGTPGALQRSHGREGRAAVTLESRRALRARAGPAGLQRDHSRQGAVPRRLAAPLAYYLCFALFPTLLFLTTLLGLLPLPNLMDRLFQYADHALPSDAASM